MITSEKDIIIDWLNRHWTELPVVGYEECEYNFIRKCGDCIDINEEVHIYKVFGSWQRIICKK